MSEPLVNNSKWKQRATLDQGSAATTENNFLHSQLAEIGRIKTRLQSLTNRGSSIWPSNGDIVETASRKVHDSFGKAKSASIIRIAQQHSYKPPGSVTAGKR